MITLVGPDSGSNDTVGIHRVDGPDRFTIVADLGAFSVNDPPDTSFFVPTGVQYVREIFRVGSS